MLYANCRFSTIFSGGELYNRCAENPTGKPFFNGLARRSHAAAAGFRAQICLPITKLAVTNMMHIAPRYKPTETAEHYRDLAMAYLEAAERLCGELCTGVWTPTFHKGQVTLWLAFHATELFIKGCICKADPSQLRNKHSLGELLLTFSELYSSLDFQPPFGPEPVPADWELMEMALESDAKLHQQLRYPADTSGKPWSENRAFAPELFSAELDVLRKDIVRTSAAVFGQ